MALRGLLILLQQTTPDSNKTLHPQCIAYCQLNCQISVESVKANKSYSSYCEVTQNASISGLTSSRKGWNWSVLGWPCQSHCSYCLPWQI